MLNSGSGYYIAQVDSMENTGKGNNYGLELTLEKFLSNGYYALMTISLYDSKYRAYDQVWSRGHGNAHRDLYNLRGFVQMIP